MIADFIIHFCAPFDEPKGKKKKKKNHVGFFFGSAGGDVCDGSVGIDASSKL
jgi:hypothetical protein